MEPVGRVSFGWSRRRIGRRGESRFARTGEVGPGEETKGTAGAGRNGAARRDMTSWGLDWV